MVPQNDADAVCGLNKALFLKFKYTRAQQLLRWVTVWPQ